MAVIALWIFFTIFMSMVANIIANAAYPITTQYQAMLNTMNNYTLKLGLNRISPYYLYSDAGSIWWILYRIYETGDQKLRDL